MPTASRDRVLADYCQDLATWASGEVVRLWRGMDPDDIRGSWLTIAPAVGEVHKALVIQALTAIDNHMYAVAADAGFLYEVTWDDDYPRRPERVYWGQDALVTDESIKRQGFNPVQRGFTKLVNTNVKTVDGVALSAISSAVTQSTAAAASWTTATAAQIFKDIALAKANILALNQGYDPDVVVVSDLAWANAFSAFLAAGYFPREGNNPVSAGGGFISVNGLEFLVTPNLPTAATALIADTQVLGDMADEELGGPGYTAVGGNTGVEVKSIRKDDTDSWRIRARRTTVPVVLEPAAAWKITGLGV